MTKTGNNAAFLRLLLVVVTAIALLALPSTAAAKGPRGDRDRDGMADKWEKRNKLNPRKKDGLRDPDKDSLSNRAEYRSGTKANVADSDRDGIGDAEEDRDRDGVDNGTEARERTNPRKRDSDGDGIRDDREDRDRDGLKNGPEDETGLDPLDKDTDDDGVRDNAEVAGKVASFDDEVLVIQLYAGGTLTGRANAFETAVCGEDMDIDIDFPLDEEDEDLSADEGADDLFRVTAATGQDEDVDPGKTDEPDTDVDEVDPEEDEVDEGCGFDQLVPGAIVLEASLEADVDGAVFTSLRLLQ